MANKPTLVEGSTPDIEGPRVNLKNVMEMLASIHNKWRLVGIAVGLDAPTLDKIRANFPIDTKEALVEVVSKWLCGIDPEPTWQGLAAALSSAIVEEKRLAAAIKERCCSQPQSGAPSTDDLEAQIEEDLDAIQNRFAALQSGTRVLLKSQGIKPEGVAYLALDLPLCSSSKDRNFALEDCRDDLLKADSIDMIFNQLSQFWSFLNYDLLKHIIVQSGIDTAGLNEYEDALLEFCSHIRVMQLPPSALPIGSSKALREKVQIKIDLLSKNVTLNKIRNAKHRIAKILRVHPFALDIHDLRPGCVEVEFLVPQCITEQLFPLTDEQKHSLHYQEHVMRIKWRDIEVDLEAKPTTPTESEGVMGYKEVHYKSLDHDLEVIQQKFTTLLRTTNQSLTSRIKPVQLTRCVLDLAHTKPGIGNTLNALLTDQRDALLYAESVPQIFTTLAPFWSPINSELLQHIISKFGCAKDKLNMDAYNKSLVKFCAWEAADIPFHALGAIDKGSRDFVVLKIDLSRPTLQQVSITKGRLAEILSVHPSALFLESVAGGSVSLLVPPSITQKIMALTADEKRDLYRDVRVLTVKWNDYEVHCKAESHLSVVKSDSWCHGKWPSVALNNGGVVVEVHNMFPSSWSYLGYRVGRLQNREITWGKFRLYDQGVYARVAITDDNTVVEVHESQYRRACFYRVGTVDEEELSIDWGTSTSIGSGRTPSVALKPDGTVLSVYRKTKVQEKIVYRVGVVDQLNKMIDWHDKTHRVLKLNAKEPSVTINPDGLAVVTYCVAHPPNAELCYMIVKVNTVTQCLEKLCKPECYGRGYFPSVGITPDGSVVEVHQSMAFWRLRYRIGQVEEREGQYSIQWKQKDSVQYDTGRYPTIAISSKRIVIKMHEVGVGAARGMACAIGTLCS